MRLTFAILALTLGSFAFADRLISIPKGNKYPFGTFRAEALFEPSRPKTNYEYLGIGIGTAFDAEIRREQPQGDPTAVSFDFAYNVSAPFPDLAPGISLGILDVADESHDGRRGFVAITISQTPTADYEGLMHEIEFTMGAQFGSRTMAFFGFALPFTDSFKLMAEHDGRRVSTGAEFATNGIDFKLVIRSSETLLGISKTARF